MPYDCKCSESKFPLASVCADDLYCPQCGGAVAWLTSPNLLKNPRHGNLDKAEEIFWVYATAVAGKRFTFLLEFKALNENRAEVPRPLVLDRCKVEPRNWPYRFLLDVIDDHERHKKYVRLRLDPDSVQDDFPEESWWEGDALMPPEGIFCSLTIVGNCGGEKKYGLLVCGEPDYEVDVLENNQPIRVDLPPGAGDTAVTRAWPISRRGQHDLTVSIRCVRGYLSFLKLPDVTVAAQPSVTLPAVGNFVEVGKSIPPEKVMGPGYPPSELALRFNSDGWKQGELQIINVNLTLDVLKSDMVQVPLFLLPRGDLEFEPKGELPIPPMFYGEAEQSKPEEEVGEWFPHVKVTNNGEQTVSLRRPTVEAETLPEAEWIEVYWVGGETPVADPIDLDVGDSLYLGVKIDLSRVSERTHAAGSGLRARISIEGDRDDRPVWTYPVVVRSVEIREPLETPLAIDFGNSNTLAAYVKSPDRPPISVLGGSGGENFPTAIFFHEAPIPLLGFDLRLMPSAKDVSAIPTAGNRLVIVASVDQVLHFRVFDTEGKRVVDTDETRRTAQSHQAEDLRRQLKTIWPPHELTAGEKSRVIDAVTSIVVHTPSLSTIDIGRQAVAYGKLNPRSMRWRLKRWLLADDSRDFKWHKPESILTRKGQYYVLKPADLICLFLEKVIQECETALRKTVTKIGLSYPANYPPRARKRFDEVLVKLEERRKEAFPHYAAKVRVERISSFDSSPDEASAVAIGAVYDERLFETKIAPDLGPDKSFMLASFDFGGGSIDSALLRFETDGPLNFKSQHLSFGGDERFGGDNVTTAVAQLLLGRFRALLKTASPPLEFLASGGHDGGNVDTDSGRNDQYLRLLAEELKLHLCRVADAAEGEPRPPFAPEGADSPGLRRLDAAVGEFLNRIKVKSPDSNKLIPLPDQGSRHAAFLDAMLGVTLDHVYRLPLEGEPGLTYSVQERVQASIKQLHDFVAAAREKGPASEPLFIVLAGAACRLPLVRALLSAPEMFGDTPILEDLDWPKSKVAFGLAAYLSCNEDAPNRIIGLSRAGHYTHGPIVWHVGYGKPVVWVPTCHHLTKNDWLVLRLGTSHDVALLDCLRKEWKITVHHAAYKLEPIGTFDLSEDAPGENDGLKKRLEAMLDPKVNSQVLLKVNGAEDDLLLRVHYGKDGDGNWRKFGDWKLTPAGTPGA